MCLILEGDHFVLLFLINAIVVYTASSILLEFYMLGSR